VAVGGNQITVGVGVAVSVGIEVSVGRGTGVLAGRQAPNRNVPVRRAITSAKNRAKGRMFPNRSLSRGVQDSLLLWSV
jgi:hypothetical protein